MTDATDDAELEAELKACPKCDGYDDECPECCPHDDVDEGYCLICGEDRTEHLAGLAYDRAKDFMKYGDT